MRTTLSLDEDVARMVEDEVRRSGESFKGVVNGLIRDGMVARRNPRERKQFQVKPFALGLRPGLSY
ncbi:MAG TPA: hypothetical protein VNL71_10735, partial [Chloroflexota bacterium]|nr:hypothetical protein [Chloroflexota bacterium]